METESQKLCWVFARGLFSTMFRHAQKQEKASLPEAKSKLNVFEAKFASKRFLVEKTFFSLKNLRFSQMIDKKLGIDDK